MFVKIGFAILTHNAPEQLLRLVKTLNAMFGAPPIVCHHDFSQCALSEALFPPNVRFIHPHIVTSWGDITLPQAALKALESLRRSDQPEWFVLLSGSDYPVRSANDILADLTRTNYDAYLDHRQLRRHPVPPDNIPWSHSHPAWTQMAYDRYCSYSFWSPSKKLLLSGSFPFRKKFLSVRNQRMERMTRWFQFNRPSRIFGGDFWFQANQKAIDRLLEPAMQKLVRYYRGRHVPDESIFHTLLCNQADLRICQDNKRFAEWTHGGDHPKWIEASDIPRILASGAFFARKFRPDGAVQALIDQTVLGLPT